MVADIYTRFIAISLNVMCDQFPMCVYHYYIGVWALPSHNMYGKWTRRDSTHTLSRAKQRRRKKRIRKEWISVRVENREREKNEAKVKRMQQWIGGWFAAIIAIQCDDREICFLFSRWRLFSSIEKFGKFDDVIKVSEWSEKRRSTTNQHIVWHTHTHTVKNT